MRVLLVVLLAVLVSIGLRGGKVAVSLYALELGAGAAAVGALAALFAVFPLLLAVPAGRMSDRFGPRLPIALGALTMAAGLALPLVVPGIAGLFACPALVGLGHVFFHVSAHNLVGALGEGNDRTRHFATFSLGISVAALIGPSAAGFAIDFAGYPAAFALLACLSVAAAVYALSQPGLFPARPANDGEPEAKGAFDLLAIPAFRRVLVLSGVALTGVELFSFYLPIYGRAIGLAPSTIGMILSSHALAGFAVRIVMHRLAQRYGELGVLTASLLLAAFAYFAVPFLADAWLLAAAAFALGLALGSAQPLTIILAYNHAPAGRSGEALGMRIMANKLTQIAVPLAFGGAGAAMGAAPVFLATGVFLLFAGALSLKR